MMLHEEPEQRFKKAKQLRATFKKVWSNLWLRLLPSGDPRAGSLIFLALEN